LLGPSILFFSPTFSTGYAFHACRRANAKVAARVGLVLAILELLALAILVTVQVYVLMM
jgi:hypothetical protein